MAVLYAYSRTPAFNPNTSPASVAKSATGAVYDISDTGFLTPLNLTLLATNTVTTSLISDANGMFPDFGLLDRQQCMFKSGTNVFVLTTTTPIPSTVPGPAGPTGPAGAVDDNSMAANINNTSSATRGALNATILDEVAAPIAAAVAPKADTSALTAHTGNTSNPHAVTKAQVGLGDADNTADTAKPVSAAQAAAIAGKVAKGELVINVKDYGAIGNGIADDTPYIQAAINAAPVGATIYFPPGTYLITAGLIITTANLRFSAGSRDYGTAIKCVTPGVTMVTQKATQFINEVTIIGDGALHGAGATVNGFDIYGDTSGNMDCTIGGSFIFLNQAIRLRGRNADVNKATISNSLAGIMLDGVDATYHTTAPAGGDKRGNQVRNCRFHDVYDKAVEITTTAKVVHAIIEDNFFDSGSPTRAIVATGTVTDPHNRLFIRGNTVTESTADAISLTYCINARVRGNEINGYGAGAGGQGYVFNNCTDVELSDTMILQTGRTAVYGRNNTRLRASNVKVRAIGYDTATVAHGFDIDASNTGCEFSALSVEGADGWGFIGDPVASSMEGSHFNSCTLGSFNSATLRNRASSGRNVYIEGNDGRKQDSASKAFDLADGVATQLATITSANAYSSFEVEAKVVGRNSAGLMYARYVRYVRPENGSPQYANPVSDVALGTITLSFAASGTTGVTVSATATGSTAFVTAHVTALAGGGAATGNARGVTVAMS